MAIDYHINLAKDLISTPADRVRFYNGMLIYLTLSAVALVGVSYLSSMNIRTFLENRKEQKQLQRTTITITGLDEQAFKNPDTVYAELETYAGRAAVLKSALSQQVQLLPVIHNLLLGLPEGVGLQSLTANRKTLSFGLVMPTTSEEAGDPVKDLKVAWEQNKELMRRVSSINPVTGERRTVGTESKFFIQFECILSE